VRAVVARCPDALFARARRGPLSPVERRALDAHLGVCELCRGSMLLAALSDEIPDETPAETAARVVRLASRVASDKAYARRRSRGAARPLAVALAAVVLAMAGAAAAWVAARRADTARRERASVSSHLSGTSPTRRLATAVAPPASGLPLATAPAPSPLSAPNPRLRISAPPRSRARHEAPVAARSLVAFDARDVRSREVPRTEGPAELFAAANAARRAHSLREAVAQYHLLQRRFPDSDEAQVSLFSAGDVLMRLGEPARALAELDRYLDLRPSGSLASEALFGRARCLDALGRRREGAEAWRRLLRDFPHAIYESTARRRLAELER
jgi:tetratricopeptide (TPR) repeat protein